MISIITDTICDLLLANYGQCHCYLALNLNVVHTSFLLACHYSRPIKYFDHSTVIVKNPKKSKNKTRISLNNIFNGNNQKAFFH